MHTFIVSVVAIILIGAFGIFGNINTIVAVYRLKPRLKSSIIVGLIAFADLFCITSEWQNALRTLLNVQSYRKECFWAISSYLIMSDMAIGVLAFDRLFAFTFPFKYITTDSRKYIVLCCLPGILSSLAVFVAAVIYLDDEPMVACNPPLAYPKKISSVWNYFGILVNGGVIACLVSSLIALYVKNRQYRNTTGNSNEQHILEAQRKLSFSCIVMILVYVFTCTAAAVTIVITKHLLKNRTVIDAVETNLVIPTMLFYSKSYYVNFLCSGLYRKEYKKQFAALIPSIIRKYMLRGKSVTVASISLQKVNAS